MIPSILQSENFLEIQHVRQQRLTLALKQLVTFPPDIEAIQNWKQGIDNFFEAHKPEECDLEVAVKNLFLEYRASRSPTNFINAIQRFSGNKKLMSFVEPADLEVFSNMLFEKSDKLTRVGQFNLSNSGPFGQIGRLAEFIAPHADDQAFAGISMQMEELMADAGYTACIIQYLRDQSVPNNCALDFKFLYKSNLDKSNLAYWKQALEGGFAEGQQDAAAHIKKTTALRQELVNLLAMPQKKLTP